MTHEHSAVSRKTCEKAQILRLQNHIYDLVWHEAIVKLIKGMSWETGSALSWVPSAVSMATHSLITDEQSSNAIWLFYNCSEHL